MTTKHQIVIEILFEKYRFLKVKRFVDFLNKVNIKDAKEYLHSLKTNIKWIIFSSNQKIENLIISNQFHGIRIKIRT